MHEYLSSPGEFWRVNLFLVVVVAFTAAALVAWWEERQMQ